MKGRNNTKTGKQKAIINKQSIIFNKYKSMQDMRNCLTKLRQSN